MKLFLLNKIRNTEWTLVAANPAAISHTNPLVHAARALKLFRFPPSFAQLAVSLKVSSMGSP